MAVTESLSNTAKTALAITVVWAVASTGGCVALYAEMQAKEQEWAQERTELSDEVAALKSRNTEMDGKIESLSKENASLRQSGKGLAALETKIEVAERKLHATSARHEKLVIEAAAAKKSLDEVRTALNEHKSRIAERRAEIEAAEQRLDDLRSAAKSADTRIDEAKKTLTALKTDIAAREKVIRSLETNLQSAQTSLSDAIDRIDKARKPGS